jgi:hypothetical protein
VRTSVTHAALQRVMQFRPDESCTPLTDIDGKEGHASCQAPDDATVKNNSSFYTPTEA